MLPGMPALGAAPDLWGWPEEGLTSGHSFPESPPCKRGGLAAPPLEGSLSTMGPAASFPHLSTVCPELAGRTSACPHHVPYCPEDPVALVGGGGSALAELGEPLHLGTAHGGLGLL